MYSSDLFDPRHILGIGEDADHAEIRRAYRRLAMRWHPDRNADPLAPERFKEIRAAYQMLTDPADLDEDQSTGEKAEERGADRHEEIRLTLQEAMLGCDKPFSLRRSGPCSECGGHGRIELARTRLCERCHGSGRIRQGRGLQRCGDCEGRGYVAWARCDGCGGEGIRIAEQIVTVHVAAGVLPGDVLRLRGLGEPGVEGRAPGDLKLTVRLLPDSRFELRDRDIHSRQPVSALRLLAGGRVSLAGPLGPVLAELDPGGPDGLELRLPGHGFPGRGGAMDCAGDLVVTLDPVLPIALDAAHRTAIEALETQLSRAAPRHYPGLHAWWEAYRSAP